ncbi:cysteine desulfurase [Mechercharimyces sp. CAU 1602]|nr:cysteine desulfurase [Mechercharimyces sp. CAU 1602]
MSIYLDHAATTPLHPSVREAMLPFLDEHFGNPSSLHAYGRTARHAVDEARQQVAEAIGADAGEIMFTSGGTESDNAALWGCLLAQREQGKDHIVTSTVEHKAVLESCHYLETLGFRVTYVPVTSSGQVLPQDIAEAIEEKTALISVMYGNNEVGTVNPIKEIGEIARQHQLPVHTDAVQVIGKKEVNVSVLPVDLLSLSSHKVNGPKGVGALYVRMGTHFRPMLYGGSQERKRRGGTENVAGIVGFGKAISLATSSTAAAFARLAGLRQAMMTEWDRLGLSYHLNGHERDHLPHILNVSFVGVETETLLMNLDLAGIACASGSACTSGTLEVSHVLEAMNLPIEEARSAVRFSFGMGNEETDVIRAAQVTADIVARLRGE